MDFKAFSAKFQPQIESCLLESVKTNTPNGTLQEAMIYSLQAGGKRFRPLLLLAVLQVFSKAITDRDLKVAASLEMIHTYSLIHDDLPAMDNDDLRRGKPTNHKVFGEGMAVLAGDGLLSLAFQVTAENTDEMNILQKMAYFAGVSKFGMVYGQTLDVEGENKDLTLEELKAIHQGKTGGLIEFAVYAGAKLAGVQEDSEEMQAMVQFSKSLGLAFQIRDDILDVTKTTEELGKTAGKDEKMGKSTYPKILGLQGAKDALTEEILTAKRNLEICKKNNEQGDFEVLESLLELF